MNKLLSQVPLQILTGFLGSGKTTLLNKIINTPKMKGTVLIINEVGEIGIDDKLISSESPVVLLDSGCICCSVQDGLVNALQFLADQKQQGELSFNRVIIETTGIADPAPIITLLFDYIEIECNYSFAGTITVIDGVNAKDELAKNYEAVKQIALADKIIISKEDRISKNDLDILISTATNLNPSAKLYTAGINNTPIEAFTSYDVFDTPKDLKTIMAWINSKRDDLKLASSIKPVKLSSVSTNQILKTHSDYQTISLKFDKPLNRISVLQAFNMINNQFGSSVLRLKGIFDFGEGYPFIIHGVCGECYPVANQAEWENQKPFSEMVVIVSPRIAADVKNILTNIISFIDDNYNDSKYDYAYSDE
jgi:G3E family GTPase